MLEELKQRDACGNSIRVGLIGAGAMGVGIAWQLARTPGMELAFVADLDLDAARWAAKAARAEVQLVNGTIVGSQLNDKVLVTDDALSLMDDDALRFDVLVESTNSIGPAARYCLAAIEREAHVVLMNAEVDLALGPTLQAAAAEKGVVVTSDAGDQHGVLGRMIDEISMWGFRIVQAGNIKGFLNRYATAGSLLEEADERHLDPVQCCAYTDGTKLNIEMALLSNAYDLPPLVDGMEGPACGHVGQVLECFDFDSYGNEGHVDFILGAEPGGGVYVVGYCDDPTQAEYLRYYKLGEPPYYLFYRPYHLCHLETPRAIALAALYGKAVLTPRFGRVADVYAHAKRDIQTGEQINHGIGGDHFYGMIRTCESADLDGCVPIAFLEVEGKAIPTMKKALSRDDMLRFEDIELPDTYLQSLLAAQRASCLQRS